MIDVTPQKYPQDEPTLMDVAPSYSHSVPHIHLPPQCTLSKSNNTNMQEIVPGVYLGPYLAAQENCRKLLIDNGITHIVCVREAVEAEFIKPQFTDSIFTYLTLEIADSVTESIIRFFPKVRQFIDDALSKNAKVLVHGHSGISRSATLVLAYIMEKYGLTKEQAFDYVKEKRACIHPNEGFFAQLSEYEPIYKARQTLEKGESSRNIQRPKRKSEHLSESIDYDLIQPPPSPISDTSENLQPITDFSSHLYRLYLLKNPADTKRKYAAINCSHKS